MAKPKDGHDPLVDESRDPPVWVTTVFIAGGILVVVFDQLGFDVGLPFAVGATVLSAVVWVGYEIRGRLSRMR